MFLQQILTAVWPCSKKVTGHSHGAKKTENSLQVCNENIKRKMVQEESGAKTGEKEEYHG